MALLKDTIISGACRVVCDLFVNGFASAAGFKKSGSSDSYVLLGGGGHALASSFASSGHDHDSRYVNVDGDTMTGPLVINSSVNNNYNEGLRITRAGNNWAGITFGSTGAAGAPTGGWFAATNPSNQFIINPDDSGNTAGLCLNKNGDLKWRNNVVIHAGNYTSYCATAGHNHDSRYILKSGDTMTGALTTTALTVTGAATFSLTINGSILGNAATASRLLNARTISLTGAVTGSGSFDGSANLNIATSLSSHTHSYINGPDNRSTNNAPSWYMSNVGSASIYTEFANLGGASSSTYENRVTFTPWGDSSGQRPVLMAFNNYGAFLRTSYDDSTWNSWNQVLAGGASITAGGSNPTALAANTTYTLSVGGASCVFTTPAGGSGASAHTHLFSDCVNNISPQRGDVMVFDGTNWVNRSSFILERPTIYYGGNNSIDVENSLNASATMSNGIIDIVRGNSNIHDVIVVFKRRTHWDISFTLPDVTKLARFIIYPNGWLYPNVGPDQFGFTISNGLLTYDYYNGNSTPGHLYSTATINNITSSTVFRFISTPGKLFVYCDGNLIIDTGGFFNGEPTWTCFNININPNYWNSGDHYYLYNVLFSGMDINDFLSGSSSSLATTWADSNNGNGSAGTSIPTISLDTDIATQGDAKNIPDYMYFPGQSRYVALPVVMDKKGRLFVAVPTKVGEMASEDKWDEVTPKV